ncbi:aldolase/citrate lyase family protein [Clostridium guangxiense]|uniref:aldolase/citrate lyase family protein n=1 Tax=Clostridium guangxiense TaxID=1662055 RepID=UPI001E6453D8|nr:aldolase/citrate lyase family protein [Clostridium guangxiense]MCD2347714.1 aldolase/citrate lyase family protein [Clostridium guangxiense]
MILSLITNCPIMAMYAQSAGIDRIMIDLEVKGKSSRQQGKGLFISNHTINDILVIRKVCKKNAIFVRINPIDNDSKQEIDTVIKMGADIIMLPYFHTMNEVKTFLKLTNGSVRTSLLVETREAAELLPKIVDLIGVNEIHFGLNDLRISCGYKTIFEPVLNGTLEEYANIVNKKKIPWGFGGIGKLSDTNLPIDPKLILYEQIMLRTSIGWLGRSFRDALDKENVELSLKRETLLLREFARKYANVSRDFLNSKHVELLKQIRLMENRTKQ